MILKPWDKLPLFMQKDEIKAYYAVIHERRLSLLLKRLLDTLLSVLLLFLLLPLMLVLALWISLDSSGPVFFRQTRVTRYGREFRIFKFRTMHIGAEQSGTAVTLCEDRRITAVGRFLRKYRLDEIPQLINILLGQMSFVGTRPEVPRYVSAYSPEMLATLLLPAGLTSKASIEFCNEGDYLPAGCDVDKVYVEEILPRKMHYNLDYLMHYSLRNDLRLMWKTAFMFVR